MTNIIKNILIVIISLFLLSLVTILIVLWTFSNSIPDYKFLKNYKPPVSSKMYSGEGDLVAEFSTEKRIFVPYEAIPKNVINSFCPQKTRIFFRTQVLTQKG
jgi:penicillin-binding protein 1A